MPRKIKVFETEESRETSVKLVIKKPDGNVDTMWFARKLIMREGPDWIVVPTWFAKKVGLAECEHIKMGDLDSLPGAFPTKPRIDAPKPVIPKKPEYKEPVRVEEKAPDLFEGLGQTMALLMTVKKDERNVA